MGTKKTSLREEVSLKYRAPPALFLLSVVQDFSLVESRPFLGGGLGVLFAKLVINPDKVGKKQSEQDGPDNDPEKVIISWRSPVDHLVIHFSPPII
jgi:hypothetical protein